MAGGGGKLLAESDATGAVQREYVWLGSMPLARIDTTGSGGGATIAVYYTHPNHLGASHKITDGAKLVVWDGKFTPFGKAHAIAGSLSHDRRFPGQYHDSAAGYVQNHRRDYDPSIGRYLQSDPIGLSGGLNTYAYVNNNPQNLIDPRGEQAVRISRWSCLYDVDGWDPLFTTSPRWRKFLPREGKMVKMVETRRQDIPVSRL